MREDFKNPHGLDSAVMVGKNSLLGPCVAAAGRSSRAHCGPEPFRHLRAPAGARRLWQGRCPGQRGVDLQEPRGNQTSSEIARSSFPPPKARLVGCRHKRSGRASRSSAADVVPAAASRPRSQSFGLPRSGFYAGSRTAAPAAGSGLLSVWSGKKDSSGRDICREMGQEFNLPPPLLCAR